MSGIAAAIYFDGRPAHPDTIRQMTAAMAFRGPDGIHHHVAGNAAIGHCNLASTAAAGAAIQPVVEGDGSLVVVLDGWLANYDELLVDLAAAGVNFRDKSDAWVCLHAYRTWGEDCARRLAGEFALVVWDKKNQSVFCAKDHAGMRPLHYHWDGHRILIASDIAGVLAAGDFPQTLDFRHARPADGGASSTRSTPPSGRV